MNIERAERDRLLKALESALEDESTALKSREPEQLIAAVEKKSGLLAELEQVAGNYCRDGESLPPDWPELQQRVADCAERNRINGGAIALNHGMVSGLLATLLGTPREQATYTARGKLGLSSTARPVGSV